jgi:hypothetical protein
MLSTVFFALSALTATALASPTGPCPATSSNDTAPVTTHDLQAQHCGEGAKISCCNSQTQGEDNGILGQLISGLNCIDVPVLAVPFAKQ